MRKSETIIQELFETGIEVCNFDDCNRKSIAMKHEKTIVINEKLIENHQELNTILLHEQEHFISDSFYTINTQPRWQKWNETRTTRKCIKRILPFEDLLILMKKYQDAYEIAEEMGVTTEFINEAYQYYKDQGLFEEVKEY